MGTNKSETAACLVFQHRLSNSTPLISHNVLQSISSVCCSYFQFWNRTQERRGDRRGVWNKNTMLRQYPVFTLHPAPCLSPTWSPAAAWEEDGWELVTSADKSWYKSGVQAGEHRHLCAAHCLPRLSLIIVIGMSLECKGGGGCAGAGAGLAGEGRGVGGGGGGGVAVYTTHSPPTLHNSDFH